MAELQFVALQISGVLFGLIMLYLTFLFYHKNVYTHLSLTIWSFAWIAFMLFVLFPRVLATVLETFEIARLLDFFVIVGFFFFAAVIFYVFIVTKRTEKRVEELVDRIAKKFPEKPKKK